MRGMLLPVTNILNSMRRDCITRSLRGIILGPGANLRGHDLSGVNLTRANLFGADLQDANLRGADLTDANLFGANLRGANLFGALLIRTDLRGANLLCCTMDDIGLQEADCRGATWINGIRLGAHI